MLTNEEGRHVLLLRNIACTYVIQTASVVRMCSLGKPSAYTYVHPTVNIRFTL